MSARMQVLAMRSSAFCRGVTSADYMYCGIAASYSAIALFVTIFFLRRLTNSKWELNNFMDRSSTCTEAVSRSDWPYTEMLLLSAFASVSFTS